MAAQASPVIQQISIDWVRHGESCANLHLHSIVDFPIYRNLGYDGIVPVSHEEVQQKEPLVELHEFQFVCDNGSFYSPAKTLVDDFIFAFGREQVRRVFLTAKAWLMANPGKRKTARGMGRFLNAWLCRESGRERTALKQLNQGLLSNGKESAEGW